MTRKQCKHCPWKVGSDPYDIPGQYCVRKHQALKITIAKPSFYGYEVVPQMACHETPPGSEKPCVGWLANQLGPGNNLGLRMQSIRGQIEPFETVGEQHGRLEDTLPKDLHDEEWKRKIGIGPERPWRP